MNLIKKIINFCRPYNWEVIWTKNTEGYLMQDGKEIEKMHMLCVVEYDKHKDTYQSYMTTGTISTDIDLNILASQNNDLKNILTTIINKNRNNVLELKINVLSLHKN